MTGTAAPAPLSAVEVFRARQRARRPTVVIFYRGERSRFCRTWLRRWLSVPALERRLALADTALIFVSSQSQGKAYSVAAQSGVPDHMLDRSIIFLGDPQHALAAYLESVSLLAPVVTNPTGHRAHAWVYDYGMVQPAVVAVAPDSSVLFAWAMQPCFRNAGGKLERPDPWDAWDYIERKLDRCRSAVLESRASSSGDAASCNSFAHSTRQTAVSALNPTMAATLPRNHGSRTSSSVAAAAGDAAEAAAAANNVPPMEPMRAYAAENVLLRSAADVPDVVASHNQTVASVQESEPLAQKPRDPLASAAADCAERAAAAVGAASSSEDDEGEFPTQIPHVRSGLSDLAAAAMESADASLSSIEANKARVKFSLADHVIEPVGVGSLGAEDYAAQAALRSSLRSDDTGPNSPDITLLQQATSAVAMGYVPPGIDEETAQFDDAASTVSTKSRSASPQEEASLGEVPIGDAVAEGSDTVDVAEDVEDAALEKKRQEGVEEEVVAEEKDAGADEDRLEGRTRTFDRAEVASPQRHGVFIDGPGSGRENIIDEFEVFDEYIDDGVLSSQSAVESQQRKCEVNGVSVVQNANVGNTNTAAAAKTGTTMASKDESGIGTNTVRNLIQKWAGLDSEKFGSAVASPPGETDKEETAEDTTAFEGMKAKYVQQAEAVAKSNAEECVEGTGSSKPREVDVAEKEAVVAEAVLADNDGGAESDSDYVVEEAPAEPPVATEIVEREIVEKKIVSEKVLSKEETSVEKVEVVSTPVKEKLVREATAKELVEKNEATIDRLKELERKAKKVEFLDAPVKHSEKENEGRSPSKSGADAVVRKMSSGMYQTDRPQGGWFVHNIFSRRSKQSANAVSGSPSGTSFLARRSMEQSPHYLRVPVDGDLATDKGALAIQKVREMSERSEDKVAAATNSPAKDAALEEISLREDKATAMPKSRSRNRLSGTKTRSLPRETKGSAGDADADESKLSRKLSLFAGGLKRSGDAAAAPKSRRYAFGRGPMRSGTSSDIRAQTEQPADRATAGLRRGSRRMRDLTAVEPAADAAAAPAAAPVAAPSAGSEGGEDDGTVKRKMSLAKIGDAFMSKLSVSYHEAQQNSQEAPQENRRSSLRFARANDSADVRRVNTNVGGPSSRREEENEGRTEGSGFGRRLWSRWAKMKA